MSGFIFQIINVALLFGVLFFFLKRMLDQHFKKERDDLQLKMQEASAELEKARLEYQAMKDKFDRLEQDLALARKEAENSLINESKKIQDDTEQFAKKLSQDFQQKLIHEEELARTQLKDKILDEAFQMAKANLASRMQKDDAAWTSAVIQKQTASGKKNYAS